MRSWRHRLLVVIKDLPCGCRVSYKRITRRFAGGVFYCPEAIVIWDAVFSAASAHGYRKPVHPDVLTARAALDAHRAWERRAGTL